jgi:inhibitor of cysteine peptidase
MILPGLLTTLWACQGPPTPSPSATGNALSDITLTETDRGRSITVARGQTIRISLPEAPTTGFLWKIEQSNAGVLELLSSDYTPPTGPGVGGAGTRFWSLLPKATGTVRVTAKHWRPSEGEQSVVDRFEVTIKVSP